MSEASQLLKEAAVKVQSSLSRARAWHGLQLKEVEGAARQGWDLKFKRSYGRLPGVGHDIGHFEASILNDFLRQHASEAYFEVEGLQWDDLDFQLDVGPQIPGINA